MPIIDPIIDEALLSEYQARLAALRYHTIGVVEALTLTPKPDQHMTVQSLHVIPEVGVEGQYPGKQWWRGKRIPGRQISALNAEVLDALEIPYDVPGDNLVIRGIDLAQFFPGDTLRVGDVLLIVTSTPHRPCSKFAHRTSPTKKVAISAGRLRGILLDAKRPATISVGDPVERLTNEH